MLFKHNYLLTTLLNGSCRQAIVISTGGVMEVEKEQFDVGSFIFSKPHRLTRLVAP